MKNTVRVARFASAFAPKKLFELPIPSARKAITQRNSQIPRGNAQDALYVL
jgi:hypothetical protein